MSPGRGQLWDHTRLLRAFSSQDLQRFRLYGCPEPPWHCSSPLCEVVSPYIRPACISLHWCPLDSSPALQQRDCPLFWVLERGPLEQRGAVVLWELEGAAPCGASSAPCSLEPLLHCVPELASLRAQKSVFQNFLLRVVLPKSITRSLWRITSVWETINDKLLLCLFDHSSWLNPGHGSCLRKPAWVALCPCCLLAWKVGLVKSRREKLLSSEQGHNDALLA